MTASIHSFPSRRLGRSTCPISPSVGHDRSPAPQPAAVVSLDDRRGEYAVSDLVSRGVPLRKAAAVIAAVQRCNVTMRRWTMLARVVGPQAATDVLREHSL